MTVFASHPTSVMEFVFPQILQPNLQHSMGPILTFLREQLLTQSLVVSPSATYCSV